MVTTRYRINNVIFTLLIASYFALILNVSLFLKLITIFNALDTFHIGFVISIPIVLIAVLNIFFTLFAIKYVEKSCYIIMTLLSSILSYATYHYGVLFDTNMIANIMQTDYRETIAYLNLSVIVWLFFLGIIPSIVISKLHFNHAIWYKDVFYKFISVLISLLIIAVTIGFYYKAYASIKRNNMFLNEMVIPLHFIYSIGKYMKINYFYTIPKYQQLGLDANITKTSNDKKNHLLILVIGETARSMNYQLNGYPQPTNQYTANQQLISFQDVKSCGTDTAVSLPCMFSKLTQADYANVTAENQDNLLDILQHAKMNVAWLDNNSGCNKICKNIKVIDMHTKKDGALCDNENCLDEILLPDLQSQIDSFRGKESLIVVHLIGSHGPAYYKRYPQNFTYFKPNCARSDIQNCTIEELVNTYDNSILYTDFILNRIINLLTSNNKYWHTAMMYVSDHGESLGENGLYLHGLPYKLAPKEQITVPLISWFSPSFISSKKIDFACLKINATSKNYSHDNIFSSILGLMDVTTQEYDTTLDIFAPCRYE